MKILSILLLSLFTTISQASDLRSKKDTFLWQLDTAQIRTKNYFVLTNTQLTLVENEILKSYVFDQVNSLNYFYVAAYQDKTTDYGISLNFEGGDSLCNLTVNDRDDASESLVTPVADSYCQNLLNIPLKHHMTSSLKWSLQKAIIGAMHYYNSNNPIN